MTAAEIEKKNKFAQLRLTETHAKQLAQLTQQFGISRAVAFRAALDFWLPKAINGEIPVLQVEREAK